MSSGPAERWISLALRAYPRRYRRERGEEISSTLAEGAAARSGSGIARDLIDLALHGFVLRLAPLRRLRVATTALVAVGACAGLLILRGDGYNAALSPTEGPAPASAWAGAHLDTNKVPDYFTIVGRDGRALGYIRKKDVHAQVTAIGMSRPLIETVDPVYGSDLVSVIGYAYSTIGIVPTGAAPAPKRCSSPQANSLIWCPSATVFVPHLAGQSTRTALVELSGASIFWPFASPPSTVVPAGQEISITAPRHSNYGIVSLLVIEPSNTA